MKRSSSLIGAIFLAACSKQPAAGTQPVVNNATEKQVEKDAKSIDEAADQAAKLIEEDARKETPQLQ